MLATAELEAAKVVVAADKDVDQAYSQTVRQVLQATRQHQEGVDAAVTLTILARAMERIGDHCVNIAEDVIFLRTGDIVTLLPTDPDASADRIRAAVAAI